MSGMGIPTTAGPTAQASCTSVAAPSRRVTDAPTRVLHALMGLCFAGAWLSADSERWRFLHFTFGYSLIGLMMARIAWGLLGGRSSRLGTWATKARLVRDLGLQLLRGQLVLRQLQHGILHLSVLALIAGLTLTPLSGWLMADVAPLIAPWAEDALAEVHEALAQGLLAAVMLHIGWLLVTSLLRRQNLAAPMWSGRLPGRGPDLAPRNHGAWALLILVALLAFWAWRWQDPSAGRTPSWPQLIESWVQKESRSGHDGGDDDDKR